MSHQAPLPREIGLGGAVMLSFNGAVGAAIFALPATLAADFGGWSPWLFPLVGIATLLIVVPFARTVAAFDESGGPATYGRMFGRLPGVELGWIYYVARATAFAANANVLLSYLARWWAGADEGALRVILLLLVCGGLAAANVAGMKRALRLLIGLTLLKTLPLIGIAIAAVMLTPLPAPGPMPPLSAWEASVLLAFYAFVGFENAVVPAGETRQPGTTLPRAILLTIAVTAGLYLLVQMAFVAVFPAGSEDSKAPLIDLGQQLAGSTGAALITLAALASLAGNLHGIMASTPRVTFAMAERGELPRWFAQVTRATAAPGNSIGFLAALAALLAVSGSFVWLAVVSTLARMIIYAATIAALPKAVGKPLPMSHWISGAIGIAICALVAAQADAAAWATLGGLALAGLLLFLVAGRR